VGTLHFAHPTKLTPSPKLGRGLGRGDKPNTVPAIGLNQIHLRLTNKKGRTIRHAPLQQHV
jgi:hypothetical protein